MPSILENFKAWLKRQPDDPEAAKLALFLDTQDPEEPTKADFSLSPEYKALQAQLSAQSKQLDTQSKQLEAQSKQLAIFTQSHSGTTASAALAKLAGKLTPAQESALTALFTQAAKDDADAQVVTFSLAGQDKPFEGSRVEALLAVFSQMGDISLTVETLEPSKSAVFNASTGKKPEGINPMTEAEKYKKQQMGGR